MKTTRERLLNALGDLSMLYPTMRFGQLVDMVATLAGAATIEEMERTSDEQLLREALDHVSQRSRQLEMNTPCRDSLPFERRQLLVTLQSSIPIEDALVQSLMRLAREASTTSYDIEDDALLGKLTPQNAVA